MEKYSWSQAELRSVLERVRLLPPGTVSFSDSRISVTLSPTIQKLTESTDGSFELTVSLKLEALVPLTIIPVDGQVTSTSLSTSDLASDIARTITWLSASKTALALARQFSTVTRSGS